MDQACGIVDVQVAIIRTLALRGEDGMKRMKRRVLEEVRLTGRCRTTGSV